MSQRRIPGTTIVRFIVTTKTARIQRKEFVREMVRYYVEAGGIRWPKKSADHAFFEHWIDARDHAISQVGGKIERLKAEIADLETRMGLLALVAPPGSRKQS